MKVSLVVASGAHQGKVVPISGQEFVIGRDPQCHLRPASQAISKRHCGILVREGKVYLADYGSTNGTLVNDELVKGAEVEVKSGATIKIGPLDFTLRLDQTATPAPDQGTPFPPTRDTAGIAAKSGASPKPAGQRDSTPNPAAVTKTPAAAKEIPTPSGSPEVPAAKAAAPTPPVAKPAAPRPEQPAKPAAKPAAAGSEDDIAAMLLGMDDDEASVPDGSTVMEMPAQNAGETQQGDKTTTAKPDEKKKATSREDMTSAASEILRKMMRRPK